MPFAVENLHVYRKSVDFADQILATTEHFPRGYGFLADQLNRASVSIAANLAEGNGRFTLFVPWERPSGLACLYPLFPTVSTRVAPALLPGRLQTQPAPRFTNDAAERPRRRRRFLREESQRFTR